MARWRLEAGAEVDILGGDEMKDLLDPTEQLLLAIRDILESGAEHEKFVSVETFPIAIGTETAGTFAAPIFRVPNGYSAICASISLWTPSTLAAFTESATETIGPAALVANDPAGALLAVFASPTAYGIGWTFGRVQAPVLRDGETLWAIGKTASAVSDRGVARVQYTLSPMTD